MAESQRGQCAGLRGSPELLTKMLPLPTPDHLSYYDLKKIRKNDF